MDCAYFTTTKKQLTFLLTLEEDIENKKWSFQLTLAMVTFNERMAWGVTTKMEKRSLMTLMYAYLLKNVYYITEYRSPSEHLTRVK